MGFFLFCMVSLGLVEFSSFAFFRSLIRNFLLFFLFSSEGKVYGKLGFWLKACRTVGHDICQDVGLASG